MIIFIPLLCLKRLVLRVKIDAETKKALIKIPMEIRQLSKTVAVVGKILATAKATKLVQDKEDFEELLKQNNKRGIT